MSESEQSPTPADLWDAGAARSRKSAAGTGHRRRRGPWLRRLGAPGTTWLAQREQGRAVEATERLWSTHERRSASKEDRKLAKDVIALIRIPALGEAYVVPAYKGTDDGTLERGFGIFDSSPRPGAEATLRSRSPDHPR